MSTYFTIEEINIIAMYKTGNIAKTINRIIDMLPHMITDIQIIAANAIRKLDRLSESEFSVMKFIPADETEV